MNFNYKEQTDRAYLLHSNNHLDEAENIYLMLLEQNPDDANVLNLLGLLYISKNKPQKAIEYLRRAFIINKSSYVGTNLGKAYYYCNQAEKAIKVYAQAIEYGESDDLYYSMAIAYKSLNNISMMIVCYEKAIQINPDNYSALYNLSLGYKSINNIDKAVQCAERCLEIRKPDDDILTLLSGYYEIQGKYNSAIFMLEQAIELAPENHIYYYNLGVLYSKIDNVQSAVNSYKKALELNPNHLESYVNIASLYKNNDNYAALYYLETAYRKSLKSENLLLSLAQTYKDLYRNDDSIRIINEIINQNINCSEAYSLLAMNYMDTGYYEEALKNYEIALKLAPDNLNYLHGKAIAYKYLGQTDKSKILLEYIISKDSQATQSLITLGMIYLSDKDFYNGMKLYRIRSKDSKLSVVFKDKIWTESTNINNKNVLVYSDCGLGDTIMFSRYLPILSKKVKSLTLQTDKDLVKILKGSFNDINIISKGILPPEYDVVIPIMDISYALKSDFSDIPFSNAYLKADEISVPDILQNNNKKVGLFWQGNKKIFKNRSLDYKYISKIIQRKDIMFYSFQPDIDINESDNFYSLKDYISDYSDTAALLQHIDILITIDSSIAHVAGALGVKTFLLLPYTAEWRWFKDTDITPWYNSIKIFKQDKINDWENVINRVIAEL